MDKKVFLLDRDYYKEDIVKTLTEKDLEKWVAEEDYMEDYTIIKIDANSYKTPQEAINDFGLIKAEDYHVLSFGF